MTSEEDLIEERRMYNRSAYPAPYPRVCHEETIETKSPGAIAAAMSVSGLSNFAVAH